MCFDLLNFEADVKYKFSGICFSSFFRCAISVRVEMLLGLVPKFKYGVTVRNVDMIEEPLNITLMKN